MCLATGFIQNTKLKISKNNKNLRKTPQHPNLLKLFCLVTTPKILLLTEVMEIGTPCILSIR